MPKPIYFLGVLGVALIACSALAKPNQEIVSSPQATKPPVEEVASNEVDNPYSDSSCPEGMVLIDGMYCPHASEPCNYYVDSEGNRVPEPENSSQVGRCGEFKYPTVCLSKEKAHKRFCIDKYPWPNKVGVLPQDWMTWYDAKKAVEAVGKRLCTDSEFTMAAEGPEMHPLAYGDGYHRNKTMCNMDNKPNLDVFQATSPNSPMALKLRALLKPIGSMPLCCSSYDVCEMAGNIDQWVVNESGQPYVSSLKSGHIFGVRNAARPSTTGHYPYFGWYATGTRACANSL
jgi:hypothetical protein